jgi:hypothetical protein
MPYLGIDNEGGHEQGQADQQVAKAIRLLLRSEGRYLLARIDGLGAGRTHGTAGYGLITLTT